MLHTIAAYAGALVGALGHLLELIAQGFERRDLKVIVPTLGAVVLVFGSIFIWTRTETVVVEKKPVSQWDTEEAVRRLNLADGAFEPDANGELAAVMIHGKKISDSGWSLLGRLHNLRKLVLKDCEVTDDGLKHLAELDDLKVLGLSGSLVTDGGLENLKHLSKLRALDLQGTLVTSAGVDWLKTMLPDCHIVN